MSDFAYKITNIILLQSVIEDNQKEFDVIRKKIERRWIQLATPRELVRLTKISATNDRLLQVVNNALEDVKADLEAEKPKDTI